MLTEIIQDLCISLPLMRPEFLEFIEDMKKKHKFINFDFTYMNQLEKENLWFIEIMQDKGLKE